MCVYIVQKELNYCLFQELHLTSCTVPALQQKTSDQSHLPLVAGILQKRIETYDNYSTKHSPSSHHKLFEDNFICECYLIKRKKNTTLKVSRKM